MSILSNVNYNQAATGTYPRSGILTEQLVSLYDIVEEKHMPQLISRYGKQHANFMMLFRSMGREEPITATEYTAHEENRIHASIKVKNDATQNTEKASVDVVNDADYMYARVGDIITLPRYTGATNWGKQAIVTAIDAANKKITIKPVTDYAFKTIPAGTILAITNGAFGAGTGQPPGTIVGVTPRHFQAQIFKESVGLQGSEFVKEKWFKVIDDGRSLPKWYTTGLGRAEYLLSLKMDGAFTMGDHNHSGLTTIANDGSTVEVMTTKGMIPWIQELGTTADVDGGFSKDVLNETALYMKRQGVESGLALCILGDRLMQSVEGEILDNLDNTGVDYTKVENTVFRGNRELSISWNFKVITTGGMTTIFHVHDNWSNPVGFDSADLELSECGIMLPLTNVKDPKTGIQMPNVGLKYLAKDGYSRRMETWSVKGAGGGLYVSDVDRADFYLRAHYMFTFVKANQAIFLSPGVGGSLS